MKYTGTRAEGNLPVYFIQHEDYHAIIMRFISRRPLPNYGLMSHVNIDVTLIDVMGK